MLLAADPWTSAANSSTWGSCCKGAYAKIIEGSNALAAYLVEDGYGRVTATFPCTFAHKYININV